MFVFNIPYVVMYIKGFPETFSYAQFNNIINEYMSPLPPPPPLFFPPLYT